MPTITEKKIEKVQESESSLKCVRTSISQGTKKKKTAIRTPTILYCHN